MKDLPLVISLCHYHFVLFCPPIQLRMGAIVTCWVPGGQLRSTQQVTCVHMPGSTLVELICCRSLAQGKAIAAGEQCMFIISSQRVLSINMSLMPSLWLGATWKLAGAGLPLVPDFSSQGSSSQMYPQHEAWMQWHMLWSVFIMHYMNKIKREFSSHFNFTFILFCVNSSNFFYVERTK